MRPRHTRSLASVVASGIVAGIIVHYMQMWVKKYTSPERRMEMKLNEVSDHRVGAVMAGGAFKDIELGGFGRVKRWIKDRRAGVFIIDGMSGIGKSFSLETALQGKKGILWMSFKKEWDAHTLSTSDFALDYDTIVKRFKAHKVATGELPIIVIEDIHRLGRVNGEALGTRVFSLANDGIACVFIVGSEPVQSVLNKYSVTGMSGRVYGSVMLEPISIKKVQEALTDLRYKDWGDRAHKLFFLVGERMHDIDKVVQAKSYEDALVSVGELIDRERKHLVDVLKGFSTEEARQSAIELLCALLRSDEGLQGAALKPEWRSVPMMDMLMEKNVVRYDFVSTERVRFHHTTMEAAARVMATQDPEAALYTTFMKDVAIAGAGDAHEEKVNVAMDALNAFLSTSE